MSDVDPLLNRKTCNFLINMKHKSASACILFFSLLSCFALEELFFLSKVIICTCAGILTPFHFKSLKLLIIPFFSCGYSAFFLLGRYLPSGFEYAQISLLWSGWGNQSLSHLPHFLLTVVLSLPIPYSLHSQISQKGCQLPITS